MADVPYDSCNVPADVNVSVDIVDAQGNSLLQTGADVESAALAYVQLDRMNADGSYLFYTPEFDGSESIVQGSRIGANGDTEYVFSFPADTRSGPDYENALRVLTEMGVTCTRDGNVEDFSHGGASLPSALDLANPSRSPR